MSITDEIGELSRRAKGLIEALCTLAEEENSDAAAQAANSLNAIAELAAACGEEVQESIPRKVEAEDQERYYWLRQGQRNA